MRKDIRALHPIPYFCYFILTAVIMILFVDPVFSALSLVGSIGLHIYFAGRKKTFTVLKRFGLIFIVLALVNPLFVHKGNTPFLYVNGIPFTVEAAVYGLCRATSLIAVIVWFDLFSAFFTSDGLTYLFGRLFPRTALALSSAFRLVPTFSDRASRTEEAIRSMGEGKGLKGKGEIWSSVVTYGLESSVETADSMTARGYGADISPKRPTLYSDYRFRSDDGVFLGLSVVLTALLLGLRFGLGLGFEFYPVGEYLNGDRIFYGIALYLALFIFPAALRRGKGRKRKEAPKKWI